jgi:hypothetical protein
VKTQDIRTAVTTGTAAALLLGGMVMMYGLIKDGLISADAGLALITTIIGAAVGQLFSADAATRSVNAYERAQNGVSEKIASAASAVRGDK